MGRPQVPQVCTNRDSIRATACQGFWGSSSGRTQEGQETGEAIVPEERQQPEAGGTREGQETGEANVPEEQ